MTVKNKCGPPLYAIKHFFWWICYLSCLGLAIALGVACSPFAPPAHILIGAVMSFVFALALIAARRAYAHLGQN